MSAVTSYYKIPSSRPVAAKAELVWVQATGLMVLAILVMLGMFALLPILSESPPFEACRGTYALGGLSLLLCAVSLISSTLCATGRERPIALVLWLAAATAAAVMAVRCVPLP